MSPLEAESLSKLLFLAEAFKRGRMRPPILIYINNYNVNRGIVVSTKMKRTIVVRRDYLHYIKKYNRFEKRHKNITAHCSPAFPRVKEGDTVTVGQCRPLSKTIRFNVIKVDAKKEGDSGKKAFSLY
jgi:ribosomal protein S17